MAERSQKKERFTLTSVIRGHHVYKRIWTPYMNEKLTATPAEDNPFDKYAVAVMKNEDIVGHIPRKLAKVSWHFIKRGGEIKITVTGKRQKGLGLEVPCEYVFVGSKHMIGKLRNLSLTTIDL
uniref:HIRAN domain-containing protein n=1 Tax=Amphimedon queenslandica TaxID=400682 RepID=A0A1X7SH94_AMPQE